MRNFYHSCKFCTLTINFSEAWPRQILLQITVFAVHLRNLLSTFRRLVKSLIWWYVLKTSCKRSQRRLEDVLKMSSRRFCKTPWRRFEDILARRPESVLKTPWRRFEDVLKVSWRRLEDVLKMFRRCLWPRWTRPMAKTNILVLKTSSEDVWLRQIYSSWSRRLEDVFKTSSEGEDERNLQDVFMKTNVW